MEERVRARDGDGEGGREGVRGFSEPPLPPLPLGPTQPQNLLKGHCTRACLSCTISWAPMAGDNGGPVAHPAPTGRPPAVIAGRLLQPRPGRCSGMLAAWPGPPAAGDGSRQSGLGVRAASEPDARAATAGGGDRTGRRPGHAASKPAAQEPAGLAGDGAVSESRKAPGRSRPSSGCPGPRDVTVTSRLPTLRGGAGHLQAPPARGSHSEFVSARGDGGRDAVTARPGVTPGPRRPGPASRPRWTPVAGSVAVRRSPSLPPFARPPGACQTLCRGCSTPGASLRKMYCWSAKRFTRSAAAAPPPPHAPEGVAVRDGPLSQERPRRRRRHMPAPVAP